MCRTQTDTKMPLTQKQIDHYNRPDPRDKDAIEMKVSDLTNLARIVAEKHVRNGLDYRFMYCGKPAIIRATK